MIAPIIQANKYRLSDLPSMPYVDLGMDRFISPLVLETLQTSIVDGLVQKIPLPIKTLGSIQPLGPEELKVKMEGERAWSWYQLHVATNVNLNTNDRVRIRGTIYKVMAKLDWSRSGFYEYHVILDFSNGDWQ